MKKITRALTALAVAVPMALGNTAPSQAATVVQHDTYNGQRSALNLKWARFTYAEHRAIYALKFESLSRAHTQAVIQFRRPGYGLLVKSSWRADGSRMLVGNRSDNDTNQVIQMTSGLTVRWDFAADVVRFTIGERWLKGRQAFFSGYPVAKGEMHGDYRGDYLTARPKRGRG